jgi:hypothetical protein
MQKPLNTHSFFFLSPARERRAPHLAKKTSLLSALVVLLSALSISSVAAADFTSNLVFITGSKNGVDITPKTFYTNNPGANATAIPFTVDNPLGTFNRTDTKLDELFINAEANTIANSGETINPPVLFYRVYRKFSSPEDQGGSIPLQLALVSGSPAGNAQWSSNLSNKVNLIQFAPTPGDYILEVYFQATFTIAGTPSSPTNPPTIFDGSTVAPYTNTFQQLVGGQLYIRSAWAPKNGSTNWSEASNWTANSAPNENIDITIARNTALPYPIIDGNDLRVHNLALSGTSPQQRASLKQVKGTLSIYGNFQDPWGGFEQEANGVLLLSSTESQVFDASSRLPSPKPLFNLALQGRGTKIMTANVMINGKLIFDNAYGNFPGSLITGNFAVNLGPAGVIEGETTTGYIDGTVTSTRTVDNQVKNSFGNIGITITTNKDNASATSPGLTTVIRNNYVYTGIGTSQSISRSFTFTPLRTNVPQFELEFKYLDTDLNGIPVNNLKLFRSDNGDIPFEPLGTSTSTTANTFTSGSISGNLAALYTLGDAANPLPVTLVSFTAAPTAQGNALLRWTTANESNNKGFGIERQLASGDAWLPVGYLATGNNAKGGKYEYVDKSLSSATFTPQAYYRLRQEDLDGKVSYSPVAVVARQAVAVSSNLVLSPVPVTGASISLTFAEAGQAGSEISIINTQGQRLYTYTTQASTDAALSLPVEGLAAGVYIVSVRVPGQALRHARFVKL